MLFVVHREQILDKAISEFKRVLPDTDESAFGKFVGNTRHNEAKYLFATVQTISRPENLSTFHPEDFDYILIDEVHKSGAESYHRILNHFQPKFLLGMTATPERTDGFNIYELFDFNVPYEIRLQKALEANMLAPFHYYGVTDFVTEDGEIVSEASKLGTLVSENRFHHLISTIEKYGQVGTRVHGLIFCSRNEEAKKLAEFLNQSTVHGRKLKTKAVTGDDNAHIREKAVLQLEAGELDYLISVDIFNEGVDVPCLNQVIMLRQTKSSIVFIQQLGRGLRKADGKDGVVVIDFIGNYANNYLIPIALYGDSSLNKDSLRRQISQSEEAGAIAGFSSISFDKISRERIYQAIDTTSLDSLKNLKEAFSQMQSRLGRIPRLLDYARFDAVDPVTIAAKLKNYWLLASKFNNDSKLPSKYQSAILHFLSAELLNGKRPQELLLLEQLVAGEEIALESIPNFFKELGCASDQATVDSAIRVLTLEFFVKTEQVKYGNSPIIEVVDERVFLSPHLEAELAKDGDFLLHFNDVIATGLYLARHKYAWAGRASDGSIFQQGERYSRKDVCRLLNWKTNQQSTIYGYKADTFTGSCPIFIKYHKSDDVVASQNYGDQFIDERNLTWFTRSNRTLSAAEIQPILGNELVNHLFAKKDDAEGTDFYYLGVATASDAKQTEMLNDAGATLPVVTMKMTFQSAVERHLYDYLTASKVV